jgi:type IV pilus assembly protein PilE
MTFQRGITLIELMIAVLIVAILAGVAVPVYQNYVQESRRATAHAALADASARQEQFSLDNRTYTATVGSGGLNMSTTTDGGHYVIAVTAATAGCPISQCYVMTASPQGAQTDDSCGTLSLDSTGNRLPAGCW